jgi:hypothetical protein
MFIWPTLPKRRWSKVRSKEKRAIALEEHQKIIAIEALFPNIKHLAFIRGTCFRSKWKKVA